MSMVGQRARGVWKSRVTALGFAGRLPAVERAAQDTEGITGCGYPVKPPDAVADVLHLQGMPPGSEECQRFL